MAKKKKETHPFDLLESILGENKKKKRQWTDKELKKLFEIKDPSDITPEEMRMIISAAVFIQNNVTPEIYQKLYDIAKDNPVVTYMPIDLVFNHGAGVNEDGDWDDGYLDDGDEDWGDDDYDEPGLSGFPIPDADKKSLVLKIQLRGVSKPPLWREVRVPADINFLQLHEIIQILFGWGNYHLWQFEDKPYSHGYRIGMPSPEDGQWDDGPSDQADETPVTMVLKRPGDKMIYLYDFGDDWVHDITVKEVLDMKTEHPVCLKGKSGNPVEDIGGPWGLADYREENGAGNFDPANVNARLASI